MSLAIDADLMISQRDSSTEDRDGYLRETILDAARSILMDTGRSDFSMRKLVLVAGVNNKTVYRLFPSKNTVLRELLRGEVLRFKAAFSKSSNIDSIEHLFETIALSTKMFFQSVGYMKSVTLCLFSTTNELQTSVDGLGVDLWHTLLERLVQDGALMKGVDTWILAGHILSNHIAIIRQFHIENLSPERFNAMFSYVVALACCAYASKSARSRFRAILDQTAADIRSYANEA